jgi:hypothetical protein
VLEAAEVELGSGYAPEVDRVCWSLLSLHADQQGDVIRRLFTTSAIIRYPRCGIVIAGIEAVERWYRAGWRQPPPPVLDHAYADHGILWTLSSVGLHGVQADQRPAAAQIAKLTLRGDRIERMDVYLLGDHEPSARVAEPRAGDFRSGAGRGRLRSLLVVLGIMAIVGSIMAAFVPATDPTTGVNVTLGFSLVNWVTLTGGLMLVFLAAGRWPTPQSDHARATEHPRLADDQRSGEG